MCTPASNDPAAGSPNRRQFLQHSSATLAGSAVLASLHGWPTPPVTRRCESD